MILFAVLLCLLCHVTNADTTVTTATSAAAGVSTLAAGSDTAAVTTSAAAGGNGTTASASGNSTSAPTPVPKNLESPVWSQYQSYIVTVHMLALQFPDNLTLHITNQTAQPKEMGHLKAVFSNLLVDYYGRVVVNGSFDWAMSLTANNTNKNVVVSIFLEISDGISAIFSGYTAGQDNSQPVYYPYMNQGQHVATYFEFLLVGACLNNATLIKCGQVVAAGVHPTDCTECDPVSQLCSNQVSGYSSINSTLSYCLSPTSMFVGTVANGTRTPDVTIYMAWQGQDSNSNTYSSARSLPSAFDQYSLAPISNTLNLISNNVQNLFQ